MNGTLRVFAPTAAGGSRPDAAPHCRDRAGSMERARTPGNGTRVLALDTTTESGSLALVAGDDVVAEAAMHSREGFGHILFERIQALLAAHSWTLAEIDCFAAAAGPGSFTGVRIGLAAAKGLAEALGKRAAAVSNLEAAALLGAAPLRAAVLDARRGEVYAALYNAALEAVASEVVVDFAAWLETLPAGEVEFISSGFAPLAGALSGTRFEHARVREVPMLAGAVGRLAARHGCADPAALDANYVRRSDAELFWREL
jgi:tRNA threonylcarbamoyladenosine biosynthesis protein TsaB